MRRVVLILVVLVLSGSVSASLTDDPQMRGLWLMDQEVDGYTPDENASRGKDMLLENGSTITTGNPADPILISLYGIQKCRP